MKLTCKDFSKKKKNLPARSNTSLRGCTHYFLASLQQWLQYSSIFH